MPDTEILPPGGYWSGIIPKHHRLKIVDIEGGQGVDFLCYNAVDPTERYHAPNTLKAALTLKLGRGHNLYSDEARPIFTIVEDTFEGHDTIGGCCSEASNRMLYGVKRVPGCRENFLKGLQNFNLDRKDIVPNVNFFCDVPVNSERKLTPGVFVASKKKPGAYVLLVARMDALAIISNCPQVNNPCNHGNPTAIAITIETQRI
ncbi:MAG: urea carboxylase [Magnetovibrio sp.]|nr:urea carboxylase [Magnetovibrio sp.]